MPDSQEDFPRRICLTPAEIQEVTGKQRPHAQAKVLLALGIPFRIRPDNSLLVLRVHVIYETEEKGPPSPEMCLP